MEEMSGQQPDFALDTSQGTIRVAGQWVVPGPLPANPGQFGGSVSRLWREWVGETARRLVVPSLETASGDTPRVVAIDSRDSAASFCYNPSMDVAARPTRYMCKSSEAEQMLALGESGRYEFKRDAESVTAKVLAALANWVALDPDREVAHLLVGVDEVTNEQNGLVYGVPRGLPKGLDRAVSRIQDIASSIRPIPADVFIVEEAVTEQAPFLRIEIRPTMPPHFDDEGRRQTRQGRSTRALTDEELLQVYLDREAGSFAERFRHTAVELQKAVGAVGTQVDEIADAIDRQIAKPLDELVETAGMAARAASDAEASASLVAHDVENVERIVRDLQDVVEELDNSSLDSIIARVFRIREKVWWHFTVDTWERSSKRAERLTERIHAILSSEIALDEGRNLWELRVWSNTLDERKKQRKEVGTLKWWEKTLVEIEKFLEKPMYAAPELPDLRTEIRANIDKAIDDPNSLTNQFRNQMKS